MAHRLKLNGYRSASEVDSVIASSMVDVVYVDEITDDGIIILADDPKWPADQQDYDWLSSVVTKTLAYHGIVNVTLTPFPSVQDEEN